jgi:hypothetical protein
MTKEKLRRLIELTGDYAADQERYTDIDLFRELQALQAEFEAWDPEAAFQATNKEAGMWQGAAKLTLERADFAERQRDEVRATLEKLRGVFREWRDGQWCPYGSIVRQFAELLGESAEIIKR